jgi:two-component system sensor histidine kinase HydH
MHDIILVSLTIVGVLVVLAIAVVMLPRLLKEKVAPQRVTEMDMVLTSFQTLGGEMKSLREQLLLKERFAALGEVSAGIAHEFRNPMGVIAGYSRLLEKSFPPDDERRELVDGILREIEGMNRVMDELLSFSRQEPIQKSRIEARAFLADSARSFSDNGTVHVRCAEDVALFIDATLVRQAVRNLVQNAFEAGASEVAIFTYSCIQGGAGYVCLEVSDNGPGLDLESQTRIFTPFYTTKPDGTGIGLALVQKIVLAHGGSIAVESTRGNGTVFRVLFPDQVTKGAS